LLEHTAQLNMLDMVVPRNDCFGRHMQQHNTDVWLPRKH